MIRSRIIKVHRALNESQTEKPDIKVEVPLRIAGDRSDVMQSGNFAVHQGVNDVRSTARKGSGLKRPRPYSFGLALVLKGKLQPGSEPGDFTVLDLYIHFDNLGNAQITQRACCGLQPQSSPHPPRTVHSCRLLPLLCILTLWIYLVWP